MSDTERMYRLLQERGTKGVHIRGVTFAATLTHHHTNGGWGIEPDDPKRITFRFVKPRQIVKKLESGVEG